MSRARLWAVVLAGGEGKRLARLTTTLYGQHVPKQFAVLRGDRSLLQQTLTRIAPLVPAERTLVIVGHHQLELARDQLAGFRDLEIVAQPRDRGTAPGILTPVARLLARDPDAVVAVFPSDHYFAEPAPLLEAVERLHREALRGRSRLSLVGIVPDRAEPEYGWIVPASRVTRSDRVLPVERFVEKPQLPVAHRLHEQGGLWNSFVCVGRGTDYYQIARQQLTRIARPLRRYAGVSGREPEAPLLRAVYAGLPSADFCRDALAHTAGLAVHPLESTGWSDWGTPDRVLRSLHGSPDRATLLDRLRRSRPKAPTTATAGDMPSPVSDTPPGA